MPPVNVIQTHNIKVTVHLRWPVSEAGSPLDAETIERLTPYITRYAQTFGVMVYAVGGVQDHLHLLLDLPPTRALQEISDELRSTTQRFVRNVLGESRFTWSKEGLLFSGVSPSGIRRMTDYIKNQAERHAAGDLIPGMEGEEDEEESEEGADEDMPDWLRDVLDREDVK